MTTVKMSERRLTTDKIEIDKIKDVAIQRYIGRFKRRPECVISGTFLLPSGRSSEANEITYYAAGPAGLDDSLLLRALRIKVSTDIRQK